MNKQNLVLIGALLGFGCLLGEGQIVTYSQSLPTSAITLTAEDYFERAEAYVKQAEAYSLLRGLKDREARLAVLKAPLADYNQAIKLNPQYAVAYYQRGNVYAQVGGQQAALDALVDYTQAIKLNPQYAVAYYQRGNVYAQVGGQQAALDDYNQAIQLVPDDPEFYYDRGLLRDQIGDQQGATTDYL